MNIHSTDCIKISEMGPGIVNASLDMPDSSANVLTVQLFEELDDVFTQARKESKLKAFVLTSAKPSIFVAGADLNRIVSTLHWSDKEIIAFCKDGREVMSHLAEMNCVTIAAIHGACVGGGLELALWCDFRIATDHKRTILGLPEVKLGLVPGWAGTVRLPRIADFETSVDLITSGRLINAEHAINCGMIDQMCKVQQLKTSAYQMALESDFRVCQQRRENVLKKAVDSVPSGLEAKIRDKIATNRNDIFPFACNIVLEHMISTSTSDYNHASDSESLAMAKVYGSDASYGLLNHFFLVEYNKKQPAILGARKLDRKLQKIGVVGVGLMGTGIASEALKIGNEVVILDASSKALSEANDRLQSVADRSGANLIVASNYEALSDCDLVIESVVEVTKIKMDVLKSIENAVSKSTIIATNTSAIPLNNLAKSLGRKENFCGLHFCHPELMELVEVVKAEFSADETVSIAAAWAQTLRKMPVIVLDRAGFVVNRLLAAMLDQAFRLYALGISIPSIDQAMRDFGFLGGPFEIVDVIGTEICMYAGREMYDGGVQCVTLSPLLPRLVKRGRLGRRSLAGFYRYDSVDGEAHFDEQVDALFGDIFQSTLDFQVSDSEIATAIVSAMVLEAARILDESIVDNPKDIDLCAIHGFSFPKQVGGLLFWADRFGIEKVNMVLNQFGAVEEKLMPTDLLLQKSILQKTFYGCDR